MPLTLHWLEDGEQSIMLRGLQQIMKRLKCTVSDISEAGANLLALDSESFRELTQASPQRAFRRCVFSLLQAPVFQLRAAFRLFAERMGIGET